MSTKIGRRHLIGVAILYFVWLAISELCWGFDFTIPWESTHLIDRHHLGLVPWRSLLYLHSQPPLLNLCAILILRAAELTSMSPELFGKALFVVLGFVALFLTFRLAYSLTGRSFFGFVAAVLLLINPGFAFHQNLFFYEFPLQAFVLLSAYAAYRYMEQGLTRDLLLLSLSLSILPLWKPLFHPAFMVLLFTICVVGRHFSSASKLSSAVLLVVYVVFVLFLSAWPLKNYLVFGKLTSSSWAGFNLSYRFPDLLDSELSDFISSGRISEERAKELSLSQQTVDSRLAPLLFASHKPSTNAINWNHVIFLATLQSQTERALQWRLANPIEWLKISAAQYCMATRATFVFPYSSEVWGSTSNDTYHSWATKYRNLFFYDLRPHIERHLPGLFLHSYAILRNLKVPYSLFALCLPLYGIALTLLTCSGCRTDNASSATITRRMGATHLSHKICTAWFMYLIVLWSIAIPSISDGAEGNRMRLSTSPLLGLVCVYLICRIREPWSSRALADARLRDAPTVPCGAVSD